MKRYCSCGQPILPLHWSRGNRICFECRERKARTLAAEKATRVLPPGNKMAAQYVSEETFRQALKDAGRKTSQIGEDQVERQKFYSRPIKKPLPKIKPKAVGFYIQNGQRVILFDSDTPPKGVTVLSLWPSKTMTTEK